MKNAFTESDFAAPPPLGFRGEVRGFADALDTLLAAARRGFARGRTSSPAGSDITPERLRAAFEAFSHAASSLEGSYAELRAQVERLSTQLAKANGELERQLAEKRALAERQSTLLAALPAGVVVVGSCGTVREANAAALRLLGSPLIGASWREAQGRLKPAECEFEWIAPGADQHWVGVEEQVIDPHEDRIVILHDVTATHEARERLARNQRLAAMGEMAARVAHQLRTPLAAAMLYASQLGHAGIDEAARAAAAQRVLSRLRSLERVTCDMLRFVRGEHAVATDIDVGVLLGEAAQVMEPLMKSRGIAFTWLDHTGAAVLHGDRRGLAAALLSLLENAVQATPRGGKVRLEGMANSKSVRISVSDTGVGIPADALTRVFEPFFSTRAEGTGLGLAIVKSVVEGYGGTIDIASSPSSGTRFTIILPRETGAAPLAIVPATDVRSAGMATSGACADILDREAA
jgi:two-component system sensor histidine kinase FlrB